jgi:ATP-binding cassette, subfamily B, bacterial
VGTLLRKRLQRPANVVTMVSSLHARLTGSSRTRALVLLWRATPALTLAAVLFVLAEGALPIVALIAMGRVVAAIPDAALHGLGSAGGHRLLVALVEAGVAYSLSLLRGPCEDALTAAGTARVDALMQRRLVAAVCAPVGIEHLEDQQVLNQLASVRGELLGGQPAGAPLALISQLGDRLTGLFACVVLMTYEWWVGLLVLVMWLIVRWPMAAGLRKQARRIRTAATPMRRSWYVLGLAWKPPAAKEVRVFDLADWLAGHHRREWLEGISPAWRALRQMNVATLLCGAGVLITYGIAVAMLGLGAYHRTISLRTLATMLPMLPASMSVGSISFGDIQLEQLLSAMPDLDALTTGLRGRGAGTDLGAAVAAAGLPSESIGLEQLSFRYSRSPTPVLDRIDLNLGLGHSLGLVGVNGAGKTTLVTLLAAMREPTGGRILIDGIALAELDARAWQQQVAVVYQDYTRLPMSAAENIGMFGSQHARDQDALERAAERAGALELIRDLPQGWDTILSPHYRDGVDLSGGQWQRIALARALYAVGRGARVLVLDEPTAQLDVRAESAFYDRFLELTAGVTSIVISHRFASVRRADRIAVLDGGVITELGSHAELVAHGGTYAEMFRIQAERFAQDRT